MRRRKLFLSLIGLLTFLIGIPAALAQDNGDLHGLSMEDLMKVRVTTVSRVPTTRAMVPAAVDVITQDDIRRSGVTSIPEALRLAAGVQVSRIDENRWAIGIRGFTDQFSRSMLVMIDGRAVYSPLFAGTYWDVQDVLLEDVDRIEVIRGPGGTLWGANAVNGIINIITKSARDTQGGFVKAGAGSEERGLGEFRYGGKAGQNLFYRGYGKFFNRAQEFHPRGTDFDYWRMGQVGFRTDWTTPQNQTLTIQADVYGGFSGELGVLTTYVPPFTQNIPKKAPVNGGNILGRWEGRLGRSSGFKLQMYYDRTHRDDTRFQEARNTGDIDFQHNFAPSENQEFAWGLGYRLSADATQSVPTLQFSPSSRTDSLYTAFVQDEIKLASERLHLTLGSKFEHNVYSGFDAQPSARAVWSFSPEQSLILSVARALRTPSWLEEDTTSTSQLVAPNFPLPLFLRVVPNPQFRPEKLIAYEAGYRVRPVRQWFLTFSSFFNQHNDLLSAELGTGFLENQPAPVHAVQPYSFGNGLHGNSHGFELISDIQAASWWRLRSSYSLLRIQLTRDPGSHDVSLERAGEGNSPEHQVHLQSSMDLPRDFQFDAVFRFVSRLPNQNVPAYATSDARLGWRRPNSKLELSLVGNNLDNPHHAEFGGGTEIRRSVYTQIAWRW